MGKQPSKKSNGIKDYVRIALRLKSNPQDVSKEDLKFFSSYTREPDQNRIAEINTELDRLKNAGEQVPEDLRAESLMQIVQQNISSPELKDKILQVAQETEAGQHFDKIAQGLNILLAGSDVAQSINQIAQSKNLQNKSRRPTTPAIPQRDQYLQQALRQTQEGNYGVSQALAPVQAEIGDQYRADLQNAKTASTGQAGAFGAYTQLAANRHNRAALDLVPLGNQVKQQNVQNYNQLLGLRQQETQNQYENSLATYPYDLQQYQLEQQMAGHLGAQGNINLRNAATELGGGLAKTLSDMKAKRRYDAIRNLHDATGNGDMAVKANQTLDGYSGYNGNYRPNYGLNQFEQAYIG